MFHGSGLEQVQKRAVRLQHRPTQTLQIQQVSLQNGDQAEQRCSAYLLRLFRDLKGALRSKSTFSNSQSTVAPVP